MKVLFVAGFWSWCQHQPAMTFLLACVCSGCLLKPAGWLLYIGSVYVQVSWYSESVGSSDSWSLTVAFLGSDIAFRSNWLIVNCNIPWCHRCSVFMCLVRCSAKGTWDDDLVVFVCALLDQGHFRHQHQRLAEKCLRCSTSVSDTVFTDSPQYPCCCFHKIFGLGAKRRVCRDDSYHQS